MEDSKDTGMTKDIFVHHQVNLILKIQEIL
jgi:hypothetical protein